MITLKQLELHMKWMREEVDGNDGDFGNSTVSLHEDEDADVSMEWIFSVLDPQ